MKKIFQPKAFALVLTLIAVAFIVSSYADGEKAGSPFKVIIEALRAIEAKLDKLEAKIDKGGDPGLEKIEAKLDKLEAKIDHPSQE